MTTPNPQKTTIVNPESSAVQSYLTMLQGVIARMATNSSNCKTLCITLVSAIVAIIIDKKNPNFAAIALLPISLLGLLDAYYLGLEQGFRNTYNEFVKKMQVSEATTRELFIVIPKRMVKSTNSDGKPITEMKPFSPIYATVIAMTSISVYPFYLTLIIIMLFARFSVS